VRPGRPCVRGLRYPVETLLELLRSGMTIDEILADYEDLERDDLLAVPAFAARLARTRRLHLVGAIFLLTGRITSSCWLTTPLSSCPWVARFGGRAVRWDAVSYP
jgi:uncharacterized protein (DUF433 family)